MRAWLKEWRDANHMTQKEAAESLDIPETTFASYEQGHRSPSVDRAKDITNNMNSLSKNVCVKWTYFFEDDVLITSTKLAKGVS